MDANFGTTAGIAEMLIQSHAGILHLLPALPRNWSTGKANGLKARGNFIVDMEWENGIITKAKIYSMDGGDLKIVYGSKTKIISLKKGESKVIK